MSLKAILVISRNGKILDIESVTNKKNIKIVFHLTLPLKFEKIITLEFCGSLVSATYTIKYIIIKRERERENLNCVLDI